MFTLRRRSLAAALILALPTAAVAGSPAAAAENPTGGAARTVTLITGDRVSVTGAAVTVAPGPGRAGIPFATSTVDGRTRVVPADAMSLVRAGKLDERLFDVTGLITAGYDDRRTDLPLIISGGAAASGTRVRKLPSLGATAVRTPKKDLARAWTARTGKGKVWLDAKGEFTAADGVQQIGATLAWQEGFDGKGVTVGVIDSGVDVTHPDLAPVVAAQTDFSTGTPTTGEVHDYVGHGTAVASILAGTGAASDGRYRGVAPGARLVSAKVGDWEVTESAVIAAMEWTAGTEHARVVNMSLGFPNTAGSDPLESAVDELTEKYGTLFVVAAGNDGNNGNDQNNGDDYIIGSPADAAAALSVGAVDRDDRLAAFSSRGPGLDGESVKPEITGPGVDITHALSSDVGSGPYDVGYGTSFAAPHVAGGAAILAQRHPGWTPAQLKAALMGTARPAAGLGAYAQGAGRVDVARAVHTTLLADPPSLSMGNQMADQPITRTVSYRNLGARPLTVALRVTAPFTVNAAAVTVPAGGTATAQVTAPAGLTGGAHTGRLTATTGEQVVTTPVAVVRETAKVPLNLHVLGRDGLPTADHYTQVIGLDTPYQHDTLFDYPWTPDVELHVPSGRYAIITQYFAEAEDGTWTSSAVAQPSVPVTATTDITVDTRAARPVTATLPDAGARFDAGSVAFGVRTPKGWSSYAVNSYGGTLSSAQLGGNDDALLSVVRLAYTSDAGVYHLAWPFRGRVPTGFTGAVTAGDLAVENGGMHRQAADSSYSLEAGVHVPGSPLVFAQLTTEPSATRHFNTAGGIRWSTRTYEWREEANFEEVSTAGEPRRYEPGRRYTAGYGEPVIAPCTSGDGNTWTGDRLRIRVAMSCDSAGHAGRTGNVPGSTALFRDGRQVAVSGVGGEATFRVPQARAGYRLHLEQTRPAAFVTATATTLDWTFTDPAAVPALDTVRIAPAGAGVRMTVPAGTRSVALDVSSDDGRTWQTAVARRDTDGTYRADVPRSGYLSLRVTAKGSAATITQTVIRALPPG
ncbi:S8 family serine peptidase [Actinoplanes sp. NBRC 103695]|uniref:S8 family peptidase n=1 Tax=Actinoplanes sp. NBRC 103695 TaxID=3032202 RepID=UPI0024A1FC9C|nr:S8 family serine peptidase [Actinoplanes sp. NBRC 103695]GLZ00674.1 serine protease [Actinoplanes sp. NBRC 103695]